MPVLYNYYNRQLITILEKSLNISGISNEIMRGGYKIASLKCHLIYLCKTKERRKLLMLERQCSLSLSLSNDVVNVYAYSNSNIYCAVSI